jgi:hypothetical protein
MSAQLVAHLLDNLITIIGGVIAILIGFRVVGPKPQKNPMYDEMYLKWGKHLKWLGPVMIVCALIQIGWYLNDH